MATWIALLRGINVVGRRVVPMQDLAALLTRDGFGDVRTYIQSGNVVFRSARGGARAHAARIAARIHDRFGFEPDVLVLGARELAAAVAANPFAAAAREPKAVHLFFLGAAPRAPDLAALRQLATGGERFTLRSKVFYLHTPSGFNVSKVASRAERLLGVTATARNWRTVTTLLGMARDPP